MKNLFITSLFILITQLLVAQSQKEFLKSYTAKGKSQIGVGLSFDFRGSIQNSVSMNLGFQPKVSYHYNLFNRLTLGGGVGGDFNFQLRTDLSELDSWFRENYNTSIYLMYYPFKSNGIFLEGELQVSAYTINNDGIRFDRTSFINPGYTIMIGKQNQIALDIKANFRVNFVRGIYTSTVNNPVLYLRIPIGKKAT